MYIFCGAITCKGVCYIYILQKTIWHEVPYAKTQRD